MANRNTYRWLAALIGVYATLIGLSACGLLEKSILFSIGPDGASITKDTGTAEKPPLPEINPVP